MGTDAKLLKDVTTKLLNLRLDHTEFTCLKALALFKPGIIMLVYCLILLVYHNNFFPFWSRTQISDGSGT